MSKKEDIKKGHEAATAICKHVDFLMSTQNPCNPDEGNWVKPRFHLCKRHFDDILKNEWDTDCEDLLNSPRRHSVLHLTV